MECPQAALFDLDDTLALSFESPSEKMVEKLKQLLSYIPLAIITGRDFPWMARDFLPSIAESPDASRFYVLPEGAAQCFSWEGARWKEWYGEMLADDERETIHAAIEAAVGEMHVLEGLPCFGERFVQKRAMVAFAALGIEVPRDLKYSWDPGNDKRAALRNAIATKLPQYDVVMGGATSIDVTRKGINKARGVRWLVEHFNIPAPNILYVGDSLFPGGNDYVVIETGVQTRATKGPDETLGILDELLRACA